MKPTKNDGIELCLFPTCDQTPSSRGLCHSHYNHVRLLVYRGDYTWPQLEKAGKVLRVQPRRKISHVRDWIEGKEVAE